MDPALGLTTMTNFPCLSLDLGFREEGPDRAFSVTCNKGLSCPAFILSLDRRSACTLHAEFNRMVGNKREHNTIKNAKWQLAICWLFFAKVWTQHKTFDSNQSGTRTR